MLTGIYCLSFGDYCKYVGQSRQIESRIAGHLRRLERGAHEHQELQRLYDLGGVEFSVLELCGERDLNQRESAWIHRVGNLNRYAMTPRGVGPVSFAEPDPAWTESITCGGCDGVKDSEESECRKCNRNQPVAVPVRQCERCDGERVDGERFCKACRKRVLSEMQKSGYLQKRPGCSRGSYVPYEFASNEDSYD